MQLINVNAGVIQRVCKIFGFLIIRKMFWPRWKYCIS